MRFLNQNIVLFLVIGVLLISVGFILGKSSIQKQNTQETPNPSISISQTPIKSGQAPLITQSTSKTQSDQFHRVVKVIDGDTIQVDINSKTETLRLIGIDAPETGDRRFLVSCFGNEATNKAKEILNGKSVYLEADPTQGERDKYNRLLRYVFLENGTNFNKLMIGQGYAHEYTYRVPYKYQVEFKDAERQAREKKLGLWADDACSSSPTQSQVQSQPSKPQAAGTYTCDCGKLCSQISTCEEAYFQLNQCGCTKRDSDSDGTSCESLCK